MEVLGKQNVPQVGPVIFTGNHMNQFVDGAVVLISNPRKISFLVADKSFRTPIIGHLSWAVGSIPVVRPQDSAKKGPGMVSFDGLVLRGRGTMFTSLGKGDRVRPGRSNDGFRLRHVVSDEEAILMEEEGEVSPKEQSQGEWQTYDLLAFVDHSKMFEKVHTALASGQSLCIFPEGGSHDRTDLLPLKVGIAAIAFGVLEKYGINVPIVPVGLTYFRGHRFRGRVVVEFGAPIRIDQEMEDTHRGGAKRVAYQALLKHVANGMRSTLVTAANYSELKLVHTFRRLFQNPLFSFSTQQKQDLARRLSVSYRLLQDRCRDQSEADEVTQQLQVDMESLRRRIEAYQGALDHWGLRDYQVPSLEATVGKLAYWRLLYTFVHAAVVWLLASIPTIILNAPVGLAARLWANREAQKDLKKSRVKLTGRDVLLSKKIVFSIVAVPALWVTYALLLLLLTSWKLQTILLMFLSCPLFSYLGVRAVEAGMMDIRDLRPVFLRLLPHFASQRAVLPRQRAQLQRDVRAFARKYGSLLGPIFTEKELSISAWDGILQQLEQSERRRAEAAEASRDTPGLRYQPQDEGGVPEAAPLVAVGRGRRESVDDVCLMPAAVHESDDDLQGYSLFSAEPPVMESDRECVADLLYPSSSGEQKKLE